MVVSPNIHLKLVVWGTRGYCLLIKLEILNVIGVLELSNPSVLIILHFHGRKIQKVEPKKTKVQKHIVK